MRVFDCNRLLGAIPMGRGVETVADVLAELDHLQIDGAATTRAWELHGDPREGGEYLAVRGPDPIHPRLVEVPVVIPGPVGAQWPPTVDDAPAAVAMRACPVRHRFDPAGPAATVWWRRLAETGTVLFVDAVEIGLAGVAALAEANAGLRILVLNAGYRELRRIRELFEAYPNLHVETGTLNTAGAVEWLARGIGAHRLVFGTGAPMWDDAGPRFQLGHLDLPDTDVALIAHGSWDRLTGAAA
jgi:hypothetical protein